MTDKPQLISLRNAIKRIEADLKAKRKKIITTRKNYKKESGGYAKRKAQDRQLHSMENDLFNTKMRWYDLKIAFQQLNKKK